MKNEERSPHRSRTKNPGEEERRTQANEERRCCWVRRSESAFVGKKPRRLGSLVLRSSFAWVRSSSPGFFVLLRLGSFFIRLGSSFFFAWVRSSFGWVLRSSSPGFVLHSAGFFVLRSSFVIDGDFGQTSFFITQKSFAWVLRSSFVTDGAWVLRFGFFTTLSIIDKGKGKNIEIERDVEDNKGKVC
ncbi:hypothetical protein CFP56_007839 [Quercus suber]|uniref:Transmembrane protein n=1 Tax=Quercus suber TaxID=58331 RepID=A0AAW0L6N0_QUESU